jgi:hypothetical protein
LVVQEELRVSGDDRVSEEFRQRLVEYSKKATGIAERAENEAATRLFLIMPFLQLLGYDPYDPDEIVPEADASFSDKFKNKVDYAIYQNKEPVIAIETKKVGNLSESNKGELKGYFNAMPSVKLGILTNGISYQLYSDASRANMMDDQPFVIIDLEEIAQDRISDSVFDALLKLRKGVFNPENVGKDAQRKLYINAYLTVLEKAFKTPQKELVRTLMDLAQIQGNKTAKLVDEQTAVIAEAMRTFFDKKLLERVGFADRGDLVRVPEADAEGENPSSEVDSEGENSGLLQPEKPEINTTETEIEVFDYVKRRLPFLIERDDQLFQKLDSIFMKDHKTTLNVSYKLEQKGKLFSLREGDDPRYRFEFAGSGTRVETNDLSDIDDELLDIFMKRVEELG